MGASYSHSKPEGTPEVDTSQAPQDGAAPTNFDAEFQAMEALIIAFRDLDDAARRRVLRWAFAALTKAQSV
jgi:hypothetical protein